MTDVTQILNAMGQGDFAASDQLLPAVYDELRALARQRLANEKSGQTLQATALVHEAYLRLVGDEDLDAHRWEGRRHFFGAAAQAMQRILVDNARRKKRIKHGGELQREEFQEPSIHVDIPTSDLLDLDQAIDKLQQEYPEKAELVRLRFFAGLNHAEAADILGISEVTARRHWRFARAWLRQQMGQEESDPE